MSWHTIAGTGTGYMVASHQTLLELDPAAIQDLIDTVDDAIVACEEGLERLDEDIARLQSRRAALLAERDDAQAYAIELTTYLPTNPNP